MTSQSFGLLERDIPPDAQPGTAEPSERIKLFCFNLTLPLSTFHPLFSYTDPFTIPTLRVLSRLQLKMWHRAMCSGPILLVGDMGIKQRYQRLRFDLILRLWML